MLPAMSACVATHAFPSLVDLESQLLDEDGEATVLLTSILRYERDIMEFADALYRAGVSTVGEYVALTPAQVRRVRFPTAQLTLVELVCSCSDFASINKHLAGTRSLVDDCQALGMINSCC